MRKIIQITGSDSTLFALCDDGTVWVNQEDPMWRAVNPIPQEETPCDTH